MKKIIVFAAAAIIVIAFLGIFAMLQYYKMVQEKMQQTVSAPATEGSPAGAPKTTPPPVVTNKTSETAAVTPPQATATALTEPMNLEFQMTGALIQEPVKLAFITNTTNNYEEVCQEGGFLHSKNHGRWTIAAISQDKTVIRQYYPDGSVLKEHTLKLTPKSNTAPVPPEPAVVTVFRPGEKEPGPFKKEAADITSPSELDKMLENTPANQVLGIIRNIPDSVVESVLNALPQDYIKQKIQDSPLGLAVTEDTYKDRKPADVANILRKVADDYKPKGEKMIVFSTDVNKTDNSPISPTATFGSGTKKIYACFENKGPLAKLDRVIIKWANTYSMEVTYWSAFMINPEAPYNFIFVKPEGNWKPGKYLVTIYKTAHDADPAAYGEFEVK
ncbi:MAG: hypothetical protein AB1599_01340 [Planctomycetota bacterium]